jgi:hypothetical protein
VLVTWGVWPPAPAADRPRRCEAVSGCTPFATTLRSSSFSFPLKLSTYPFSQGLPGSMAARSRTQDPSLSHSLLRLGCLDGTFSPSPLHPLVIHFPPFPTKHSRDPSVAVSPILRGQLHHLSPPIEPYHGGYASPFAESIEPVPALGRPDVRRLALLPISLGQEDVLIQEVFITDSGRHYRRLDVRVSGTLEGWVVKEGLAIITRHFLSAPGFLSLKSVVCIHVSMAYSDTGHPRARL